MLAAGHSARCLRIATIALCLLAGLTNSARAQCSACIPPPPVISSATLNAAALLANGGHEPEDVDFGYEIDDDPRARTLASFDEGGLLWDDTITVYPVVLKRVYGNIDFNAPFGQGVLSVHIRHELSHKCLSDAGIPDDNSFDSCQHIAIRTDAARYACHKASDIAAQIAALQQQSPVPTDQIEELEKKSEGLCKGEEEQREKTNTRDGAAAAKNCLCGSPIYTPSQACPDLTIPQPPAGCSSDYPNNEIIPDCPSCP